MSKKVTIISSTPRKNGNSELLCLEFMKGAKDAGNDVEIIKLREHKINYCYGCGFCSENNYTGCAQNDEMNEIADKLTASDVIVFATPVYFYSLCGQMKTFLDRCCAKYTKMANKSLYYILTAADSDEAMLERAADAFRGFADCLDNPCEKGSLYAAGLWHKGEVITSKYLEQAYNLGKNV